MTQNKRTNIKKTELVTGKTQLQMQQCMFDAKNIMNAANVVTNKDVYLAHDAKQKNKNKKKGIGQQAKHLQM